MTSIIKESQLISIFQSFGLSQNESQVFLALTSYGKKGSIVKELNHILPIQRTNIYNILHKLIEFGCVKEGGQALKAKNATIYIASEPIQYLNELIEKKQDELKNLQKIKQKYSDALHSIFQRGLEVSFDDLDLLIKPYFEPLVNAGWKIKSYTIRKEMFDYEVYDCVLFAPHAKFLKDCSFHLFIFGYDIQNDKTALDFFSKSLKRKTKEMKTYSLDINNLQLIDDTVKIFDKTFLCFKMKDGERNIGKAIILPLREKLFYFWAESDAILKEMAEPIFRVNNLLVDN